MTGATTGKHEPAKGPGEQDRGSLSTETVLVVPLVVLLLLLVVGASRLVHARALVDQAADQSARAAATAEGTAAQAGAEHAATAVLAGAHNCGDAHVAVSWNQGADSVTTTVSCTVALSDLLIAGFPGHETLTASATAPRNLYAPGN